MDFSNEYQLRVKAINDRLLPLLHNDFKAVERSLPGLDTSLKHLLKLAEGGKKLRGVLFISGFNLFGDWRKYERDVLKVSAGIEVKQLSLLVLDDIIDHADMRRDMPTLDSFLISNGMSERDAKGIALSMSFYLSELSYKLMANTNFRKRDLLKTLDSSFDWVSKTALGEAWELIVNYRASVTEDDVSTIHKYKTGFYSFVWPLLAGLRLSGAYSKDRAKKVKELALSLNALFQLVDDVLGVIGDEHTVGKPVADIREKKKTLFTVLTKERLSGDDRERFNSIYSAGYEVSLEDEKWVLDVFKRSGVLELVRERVKSYESESLRLLRDLRGRFKDINTEEIEFLEGLVSFIAKRSY